MGGVAKKKTEKLRHLILLSRVTYWAPLEMLLGFCKIPEIWRPSSRGAHKYKDENLAAVLETVFSWKGIFVRSQSGYHCYMKAVE